MKQKIFPLLLALLLVSPLFGEVKWSQKTEKTEDKAYATQGQAFLSAPPDVIWQEVTKYDELGEWMTKGLDQPENWTQPTYIQQIIGYPDLPAAEIIYGIKLFGFIDKENLSVVFAIQEDAALKKLRLELTRYDRNKWAVSWRMYCG